MPTRRPIAITRATLAVLGLWAVTPAPVAAQTLSVSARANIFGAGHAAPNDTPSPSGGGGGLPPPGYQFAASPGLTLTFSSVTGTVDVNAGTGANGPDGPPNGAGLGVFDVASHNGIAGLRAPTFAFAAGVFLTDAGPADPAPSRLDFTALGTDFATLSPRVGQTFFVGDGRTAGGDVQEFVVRGWDGRPGLL